jgi:hypothetical protein
MKETWLYFHFITNLFKKRDIGEIIDTIMIIIYVI